MDKDIVKLKGDQALAQIMGQGTVDVNKIDATGRNERENIKEQSKADMGLQGMKGAQAKEQIETQGSVDLSKIGATGSEERKTMNEQNRMEAKTAARQQYARGLANVLMTTTTAKGGKVYLTFVDEWLDTLPVRKARVQRILMSSSITVWYMQVSKYQARSTCSLGE